MADCHRLFHQTINLRTFAASVNSNKKVNENKSRKIFLLLCNDDRPVTDLCLWPGRCHFHRKVSRYSDSQSNGLLFPLFFLLQFLLVVNFIVATIKHQYLKRGKWGLMLTHFAFIIILLGALTSFLFGEEGILHLREGETSNQIAVRTSDNTTFHTLPFSVELKKFTLTRYPGSASPSSYESEVIVHVDGEDREERIFMNNVLDVKGYRFFQASYDQDEHGTILSVNRDVAGRNITYTGYLLLVIGLILCLVGKDSRFMRQSRRLKELRKATNVTVLLFALLAVSLSVNAGGKASRCSMPCRNMR